MLVDRGLAQWVGDDPSGPDPSPVDSEADMTRILARIDRLVEGEVK
jgi:hypothetical protein